jgi:anti-sigma factor RsiW
MNCKQCRPLLSAHLDGDSEGRAASEIRRHVENCPDCLAELERLEELAHAVAQLPRFEPDEDVVLVTSARLRACASTQRRTQFGAVMDMDELADFLRVDPATIGAYLAEIPCFELGGKLLFRRKSVEAWIRTREMHVSVPITGPGVSNSEFFYTNDERGVTWRT